MFFDLPTPLLLLLSTVLGFISAQAWRWFVERRRVTAETDSIVGVENRESIKLSDARIQQWMESAQSAMVKLLEVKQENGKIKADLDDATRRCRRQERKFAEILEFWQDTITVMRTYNIPADEVRRFQRRVDELLEDIDLSGVLDKP